MEETVKVECALATANVLTLLPSPKLHEIGLQGRARSEALQKIFHQAGYHLIGVQETRMRKEARIDQDPLLCVQRGSDRERYIWSTALGF